MRDKSSSILLYVVVFIALGFYLFNIYGLVAKTYYVNESDLYRIDSFYLSGRAYEQSEYRGRGNSKSKVVFRATNDYNFSIDDRVYWGITSKDSLLKKMMNHGLKFTVYSDRNTYDEYSKSNGPIFIKVYQLQIEGVNYIDIAEMNSRTRGNKFVWVFMPPVFIAFFWLLCRKQYLPQREMILICIGFFVTVIGLLLLTLVI